MDPDFLHSAYTNCVRLDPLGDSAFLFQRALRVYHNDTAVRRDLDVGICVKDLALDLSSQDQVLEGLLRLRSRLEVRQPHRYSLRNTSIGSTRVAL